MSPDPQDREEKREALDPEDETIPVDPRRRRFQIALGLVLLALILGAIIWFTAENPRPRDPGRSVFGAIPGRDALSWDAWA